MVAGASLVCGECFSPRLAFGDVVVAVALFAAATPAAAAAVGLAGQELFWVLSNGDRHDGGSGVVELNLLLPLLLAVVAERG